MTVVLTSFQVTVNALKGILQYIESNEFKEEFGDDLYLILHLLNQDCVESYTTTHLPLNRETRNMTAYTYGYNVSGTICHISSQLVSKNKQIRLSYKTV